LLTGENMQYLLDKKEYQSLIASNLIEGRKQIMNATLTILSGDPSKVTVTENVEEEVKAFLEELKNLRKELDTLRSKGSKDE
jgi:hypothetical protein